VLSGISELAGKKKTQAGTPYPKGYGEKEYYK